MVFFAFWPFFVNRRSLSPKPLINHRCQWWATNHSFNGNGSIVKNHWKNHWYQWLRSEKPLKNHWHQWFTCKKTIGKPLTTMVFLVKTITIPLWSKFYHRSALTKTKSAVLPTSLMSFYTCLEHFNLTNKYKMNICCTK